MECLDVVRMMTVAVTQRKAARGLPQPGGSLDNDSDVQMLCCHMQREYITLQAACQTGAVCAMAVSSAEAAPTPPECRAWEPGPLLRAVWRTSAEKSGAGVSYEAEASRLFTCTACGPFGESSMLNSTRWPSLRLR